MDRNGDGKNGYNWHEADQATDLSDVDDDDDQLIDDRTEQCNTEVSDGDEFLRHLRMNCEYDRQKAQYENAQASSSFAVDTTETSHPSTSTIATTSAADSSTCSTEQRSRLENFKSNIQMEVNQRFSNNVAFDHLLKHPNLVRMIETIVEECVSKLQNAIANHNETVGEPRKKRKHHEGHHRSKKEKIGHYSSASSSHNSPGPSTATPKYAGDKKSNKFGIPSKDSTTRDIHKRHHKRHNAFGDDFYYGRSWKSQHDHRKYGQNDHQIDYGRLKNVDKSLYLASPKAEQCPLCHRYYKRMVSHFRRVHSKYEVFVSRVSQNMANSLMQTQSPAAVKYAKASGMQYLKMMCPFCEIEKDFFAPYWTNHMRTHTGEYTNKCIDCGVVSLNANHCGRPTSKQKCHLYEMGLTGYICIRCNYVQIDKKRIISHLKTQHDNDRIAIVSIENEFREVVIIPPLRAIHAQANPNGEPNQAFVEQQPLFAENDQMDVALVSGTQVIENVLVPVAESEAPHLYGHDENDEDFEITGEISSNSATIVATDVKVDQVDEGTLQNIANNYFQNSDTDTKMVRPWIDADYAQKACIDSICQFALYKCMYEKCMFATNSMEKWFIHMKIHLQLIDHFKKKEMLEKFNRDNLIKFRECPYCPYHAKANHDFIRHVEEEHHRSIFQCVLCYYRTIEPDNMVLHMKKYHRANGRNEIYLCGKTREFEQQDEEILQQDFETNVKKILCGQDECSEEFACYNSLYAHLVEEHPGSYTCSHCNQTMGLDESMITEHFSKSHPEFKEFQCPKCINGFDNVNAIREHMSIYHPSDHLIVGARRTCERYSNEIQWIYVGDVRDIKSNFDLYECSKPEALNGMDPEKLDLNQQREELKKLHFEYGNIKELFNQPIPSLSLNPTIMKYERYAQLAARQDKKCVSSTTVYKCITDELMNVASVMAKHIDCAKDVIPLPCKPIRIISNMQSMLRHRLEYHTEHPMVFLKIEKQQLLNVLKIIRCTFQCQLCSRNLVTHMDLLRHFNIKHPNQWIAARICVKTHVIESNDPQKPNDMRNQSVDFFYCTFLKCTQPNCHRIVGTRTQAIAHYNEYHNDIGSKIDGFEVELGGNIIANNPDDIDQYVQETKKVHQMHLFECQHCRLLFDSLDAIKDHFARIRNENPALELRFVVKRLFRCLENDVIRTFAGMKRFKSKHQDKMFTLPVNMLLPRLYCGLCDYNYSKNGDLIAHFERCHADGDVYSDRFLETLELPKIDANCSQLTRQTIDACKFTTGCCANNEYAQLCQIVPHFLGCKHRFLCDQCPDQTFSSAVLFVTHCRVQHQNDHRQIINDLHDLKKFSSLISKMQIILPNGFVVALKEIRNTALGNELQMEIGKLANESWKSESQEFLMTK